MVSKFYGLPLPRRGESFLLRTADNGTERAVLVDAGFDSGPRVSPLFERLKRVDNLQKIDRFICTHEDSDHCGGVPNFIRDWMNSGRSIEEVWLPGLWSVVRGPVSRRDWDRIHLGALQAMSMLDEPLQSKIQEIGAGSDSFEFILEEIERVTRERNLMDALVRPRDSESAVEEVYEEKESDFLVNPRLVLSEVLRFAPPSGFLSQEPLIARLIVSALFAHGRIARIVTSCRRYRIPVRWFDFHQFEKTGRPSGGDANFLTPVNSVEVVPLPRAPSPLLFFLALTLSQANVESLVFLRHETRDEPSVLFTADSRLCFGISRPGSPFPKPISGLPVRAPLLATAMHHGSETNQAGYGVLAGWLARNSQILVRNGGAHIRRIAPSFLKETRFCVWCHRDRRPPQLVELRALNGTWTQPLNVAACTCR